MADSLAGELRRVLVVRLGSIGEASIDVLLMFPDSRGAVTSESPILQGQSRWKFYLSRINENILLHFDMVGIPDANIGAEYFAAANNSANRSRNSASFGKALEFQAADLVLRVHF